MIIPPAFVSSFLRKTSRPSSTAVAIATIVSMINASPKVSTLGEHIDARPTTNKILKMLLPIILPIAISDFFLSEAAMQVISSGSDVPNATTVSDIAVSYTHLTLPTIA